MRDEPEILFDRKGVAGIVTLNRPGALNALTHNMVRLVAAKLDAWKADAAVTRVVVRAQGERAFSAGGDLREVTEWGRAGRYQEALVFWRDEYLLNAAIKRYPKPYVALIDGIVMGGGVGVSVHGSHRVAGERFQFAMPEVGIGFFPDVGATWFLPRLKGEIGSYCALTGERLKTADGVAAGVASHHVRSARLPELTDALCGDVSVDAILAAFAEALEREAKAGGADAEWAAKIAAIVRGKSPMSLRIALQQMRRGKHWPFEECMQAEFRIVSCIIREHDFYEGVRAVIVDKDNRPRWRPATLAEVTPSMVEAHFAPLDEELPL